MLPPLKPEHEGKSFRKFLHDQMPELSDPKTHLPEKVKNLEPIGIEEQFFAKSPHLMLGPGEKTPPGENFTKFLQTDPQEPKNPGNP